MSDRYEAIQGTALVIDVTLRDAEGVVIDEDYSGGGYVGTEVLTTTVWPGGTDAASITVTTDWVLATAGTIAITIPSAQSALMVPGRYELLTTLDDGSGEPVPVYTATVDLVQVAEGLSEETPPTILTIAEAAANIPGFDATAPGQIHLLIDATQAINDRAKRVFPLATHDETHEPGCTRTLRLKQYPVRSISRLCAGLTTAVSVVNTTLVRPSISLTPSTTMDDPGATVASVVLSGYSSGVATTTTLLLSTYTTMQTLVNAINAVSGWTATLQSSDYAALPSVDILPDFGSRDATTAAELRIYAREIQRYDVNYATGVVTIHETLPFSFRYPDRTWGASRVGTVRCVYTAGYDSSTMPGSLKRACCILVKGMAQKSVVGLQSQQKSGDQFAIINQGLMNSVEDLILPHCRRGIY